MCQKEWKKNQKKAGKNANDIFNKIKRLAKDSTDMIKKR